MYGGGGRLKEFFYRVDSEFVVIMLSAAGEWILQRFACTDGLWQLSEEGKAPPTWEIFSPQGGNTVPNDLGEAAGWAAAELQRKGWHEIPLLFMVPECESISYALNLPPGLTSRQQQEAAYWEFDDKLLARGLSAENFACICIPAAEGKCTITGVRKGYLDEVEKAFAQAELRLADIFPCSCGALTYLQSSQRERMGFKGRKGKDLVRERLLACWSGLWLVVGLVWLAVDVYHYQQASSLAADRHNELMQMAAVRQEMDRLEVRREDIARREQQLQRLSSLRFSWYSLLVHLGTDTTPGVIITDISLSDDGQQLNLGGQAVSYDCLADFMSRFEEDGEFFAGGVTLENSAMVRGQGNEPDKVKFSLAVNGESGHAEKTAAKN